MSKISRTFTNKEQDVISVILSGKTAKSSARLLNISFRTVEWHTKNILLKTNCYTKQDLISYIEKSHQREFYLAHYKKVLKNFQFYELLDKVKWNRQVNPNNV